MRFEDTYGPAPGLVAKGLGARQMFSAGFRAGDLLDGNGLFAMDGFAESIGSLTDAKSLQGEKQCQSEGMES